MITETTLYWFTRLSHIHEVIDSLFAPFMALTIVSFLALIVLSIVEKMSCDNDEKMILSKFCKAAKKTCCTATCIVAVTMICNIFVPTTKEMAAIIVIPKIANNESIKDLGDEIVNLAKEWMKEIHPSKIINDSKNK